MERRSSALFLIGVSIPARALGHQFNCYTCSPHQFFGHTLAQTRIEWHRDTCAQAYKEGTGPSAVHEFPLDMPLTVVVPDTSKVVIAASKVSSSPTLYYRELRYPLDDEDLNTLRQMRLASGTYYDRIPTWLEEIKSGHRIMWFIYLSMPHIPSPTRIVPDRSPLSPASLSFILNTPPTRYTELPSEWDSPPAPPIAMVCLLKANPQDATLASIDAHRYELTSLWIYPAYRPLGVGSSIIAEMEKQAALRGASFVTFNTTAGSSSTLRTFQRIGYREYKPREHRYSVSDVLNAGLPIESTLAAFFEKRVDRDVEISP